MKRKNIQAHEPAQTLALADRFPFDHLTKGVKRMIIMLLGPFDAPLALLSRFFRASMNTRDFWLQHFMRYFPKFASDLKVTNINEDMPHSFSERFGVRFTAQRNRLGFSYLDMLNLLIQRRAKLDATNHIGKTPLMTAVSLSKKLTKSQTDVGITLIQAGATMHAVAEINTPFMSAIAHGHLRLVQAMIHKGVLPYINYHRDPRPAIIGIMYNKQDIMWTLLANGMTTSYRLDIVSRIVEDALLKNGQTVQLKSFQAFKQHVRPEEKTIDLSTLASLIGTEEMHAICKNAGVSLEELLTIEREPHLLKC